MNDLFQNLLRGGVQQAFGSNRAFELGDAEGFWLVTRGTVDLFSVPIREGVVVGLRDHLCRVNKGNIFFSIPPTEGGENLVFEAVGGPETEVVKASISTLQACANEAEHTEAVRDLVDTWVLSLCIGVSCGRVALNAGEWLEQGRDIQLEHGSVLSTKEGLVWAFQLEGSSRFLDRRDIGIIQSSAIVPLCRYSWLSSEGPARFHGESTLDLLARGSRYWQALESFHLLVSRVMSVSRRRVAEEARRRLAKRREEAERMTRQAYSGFAAVLGDRAVESVEDGDAPLLAACRIIGRQMKLEVVPGQTAASDDLLDNPLQRIAKASLFRIREVLLRGEWWRDDNGPLLAFLEENDRPVGLLQAKPGRYILHDSVEGTKVAVNEAVAGKLKPSAYMFYKTLPPGPVNGMDLLRLGISGTKQDLWTILAMGVSAGLLSLIMPVATGHLYDTIIPSGERSLLFEIVAALLVAALATGILGLVQALAQLRVAGRTGASVEAALWDRLINLPAAFFKQYTAGDLANRALGVASIQQLISGAAIASILSAVFLSFNIALLYYYGGIGLFLAALAIIFVSFVLAGGCYVMQLRFQRPLLDVMGRLQGLTFQLINGIAKLRVSGAEKRAYAQWARKFADQKSWGLRLER